MKKILVVITSIFLLVSCGTAMIDVPANSEQYKNFATTCSSLQPSLDAHIVASGKQLVPANFTQETLDVVNNAIKAGNIYIDFIEENYNDVSGDIRTCIQSNITLAKQEFIQVRSEIVEIHNYAQANIGDPQGIRKRIEPFRGTFRSRLIDNLNNVTLCFTK